LVAGAVGAAVDARLEDLAADGFVGAVLVSIGGEVVLRRGYGSTEASGAHPVTPETLFFIASMTKAFTGVALALGQDLGYLTLAEPLGELMPDLPDPVASVTYRQLLSHTAGISSDHVVDGIMDRDTHLGRVLETRLVSDPGAAFLYSGAGFWLAAGALERATGGSYRDFLHREIFAPAGMASTALWYEVDEDNASLVAQKQGARTGGSRHWGYQASGGIASNLVDMERWFAAVVLGDLLTEEGRAEVFANRFTLGSGTEVGLGWYRRPTERGTTRLWSTGGESFGHNAELRWYEEERVLILVLSSAGFLGDREAMRVASDAVEAIVFGSGPRLDVVGGEPAASDAAPHGAEGP
jgi:CubicO group peptidase (beta-lactamase class C family)